MLYSRIVTVVLQVTTVPDVPAGRRAVAVLLSSHGPDSYMALHHHSYMALQHLCRFARRYFSCQGIHVYREEGRTLSCLGILGTWRDSRVVLSMSN